MIICPTCKAQLTDDVKFCPTCGQKIEAPQQSQQQFSAYNNAYNPAGAPPQTQTVYVSPSDKTAQFDPTDIQEHKLLAALSYLGLTFIMLVLVAAPSSKFARFHANQSLALQVSILLLTLVNIIPILGWIAFFGGAITLLVFTIMGLVNALSAKAKEVPLVGKIKFFRY